MHDLIASIGRQLDDAERAELTAVFESLRADADRLKKQRDEARAQREEARAQRDEARVQRDEARLERDVLIDGRGKPDKVLVAQKRDENRHCAFPLRHDRLGDEIAAALAEAGISTGTMLEIGGRDNPYKERFADFEYSHLDLSETGPDVIVGDITRCPHIPDGSFDVIVSVDVFEHIDRPWLAAKEITRLLRPGGLAYHSTLFSWRYHPCPIDYWRFTPDALRFIFDGLDCVDAHFDTVERRRNIVGREENEVQQDAFGGWRENWRVTYVGRKPSG